MPRGAIVSSFALQPEDARSNMRSLSRLSLLVDLAAMLTREVDLDSLLGAACARMADALDADRASVWLVDGERGDLVTRVAVLPELPELRLSLGRGLAGHVAEHGESIRVDDVRADARFDPSADKATGYQTRSALVVPLREHAGAPIRGVAQALNKRSGPFDIEDERYLEALASQLARALGLTTLRAQDSNKPGLVLRGPFNHIVGRSPAMERVYERVARAAQTDATVIFYGETGTGKGLLARAVHVNSRRQSGPFVTVDCTTLPATLVESELFGHERGAFTGADRRVPGKVEVAAGGTLLLDEIGDLPLDSQGKLLRTLQERTFERVGGREPLQADVRVLAATHRDLKAMVREGRFREDLYYRLKVVEIEVPPLRERGHDEIEILARHFTALHAARHDRPELKLDAFLPALLSHSWPGNVRELEHWVESATVLAGPGGELADDLLPPSARSVPPPGSAGFRLPLGLPLTEVSIRYIRATVEACGGNKAEAARRLGVGRNTVLRAMKRAP